MSQSWGDRRDLMAGLALAGVGIAVAARTLAKLSIGTPADMGPGFFPLVLGTGLALSGACIAWGGLARDARMAETVPPFNVRAIAFVVLAVALFALTVRSLGLVPSSFLLVFTAGLADPRNRLPATAALAAGLSAASWLIFVVGLRMPLPGFWF